MIYVVGTGPGKDDMMTIAARQLIDKAEILVGWPRLLSLFPDFQGERVEMPGNIDQTMQYLARCLSRDVVVLASGDPMLFGIGKRICQHFQPHERQVVPGISSIQMLFSEVGLDMNNLYISSSHGKLPDFDFLFAHDKVALVTDKHLGPFEIAQQARLRQLERTFIIGENLGYSEQRIWMLQADQVQRSYDMNVVVVLNERGSDERQ
ncbi:cobalt-precorrin-7 (C(5))-methyltransferase [Vibrio mangrovi]|uniref:Cobalt-precorrin-7 (C(5))-methyltransferase n=1 Tax=Vibrio mangrovi TaxID=474394 RepID=A0A1Y6J0J3_9VIBR|nr:cobalt-precorrin-7 (C(5))-methyltransferase [Vibrio mangrovi]MDW6005191.1 cobalt-precorrin-7 (C(5))-methyltransferase [Vibrio mangrovi]SMS02600.1 putative cobalt-precorrin-6Y C(5)-methyltransferase [Vibrio mangrovi]